MIENEITVVFLATVAAYVVSVTFACITAYVYWQQSWKHVIGTLSRLEWPKERTPDYQIIAGGVCVVAATEVFARGWWGIMLIASLVGISSGEAFAINMANFMLQQIWIMLPALLIRVMGYGMHVAVHVRTYWWKELRIRHMFGISMGFWLTVFGVLLWVFG